MANRKQTEEMLRLTCSMWDDEKVFCYQDLNLVKDGISSVFLAGPSSREDVLEFKWRVYAVHYLREAGFCGGIYVPEPRENDWGFKENFPMKIVEWESKRLLTSTLTMFWVPRHPVQLPGRVTNTELGFHLGMAYADPVRFKERVVFGYPQEAWKINSEKHWANIAGINPFNDLKLMCEHVQTKLKK